MIEKINSTYGNTTVEINDLLTVKDIMQILKISRPTAYQLLKNKKILSFLFAGKYLVERSSLLDYLFSTSVESRQLQGNSCALNKQKECAVYE